MWYFVNFFVNVNYSSVCEFILDFSLGNPGFSAVADTEPSKTSESPVSAQPSDDGASRNTISKVPRNRNGWQEIEMVHEKESSPSLKCCSFDECEEWWKVLWDKERIHLLQGSQVFRKNVWQVCQLSHLNERRPRSGYAICALLPKKDERYRRRGIHVEPKWLGMGECAIFRTLNLEILGRTRYKESFHQDHISSYIWWKRFASFR